MTHQFALRHQRGATLVVSLIMLVILTLFAVTGFNLSSVNLKIAGNFQNQKSMEAMAQQAIEQLISTPAAFNLTPTTSQTCQPSGSAPPCAASEYLVNISAPKCNYSAPAPGYSLKLGTLVPDDNDWEVTATVTDTLFSSATATVSQGVRMRMLAGNCPP